MSFALFRRKNGTRFFDLFSLSASNIRVAAEQFVNIVEDFTDVETKTHRLKETESEGDSITHQILALLNESFMTPIDREDISALAGHMDDVLDEIEGAANRMLLFDLPKPTPQCLELAKIIAAAAELIEKAVRNLRHFSGLKEFLTDIHRLENEADHITRQETARLFHDTKLETRDLIKWKEIYARLEHTADRMEDVADVIEDIVVKNS